mmetsp:Transcript_10722/g.18263  ORF Transcript_10722/g.18263 Transcript_10722/m.18263 type:complete len:894 (-) Transcript_10722:135-2816(-)
MGSVLSYFLVPICEAILVAYSIAPFSTFWTDVFVPTGLIKLVIHRYVLNQNNLYRTPVKPIPKGREKPSGPPSARPDDGFGTDYKNPTTAMEGAPIGRNMPALPRHLRDPHGKPDVQMVAQRLLAREEFKPAASQLNVLAASWIQAMVHDWIGHFDGAETETLDKGGKSLCPFAKSPFSFKNTKTEKIDGVTVSPSQRTNWWDASFVYGNNSEQIDRARTKKGGKMVTSDIPHALAEDKDGIYFAGDNKNSWVGVALLQDLFIREHNYICDNIAAEAKEEGKEMTDEEIFGKARVVVSSLVAKIHTVDWTVELLKTKLLQIGMNANWDGLLKAFGIPIPGVLSQMGEKKGRVSDNKGTPFCLTEEFAAVYRLHSLSPPGLILGDGDAKDKFIGLEDLLGDEGRKQMRETKTRPKEMMKSCLHWPCGALMSSNYPNAFRDVAPTDDYGKDLKNQNIDLAALDLFRDRERGILKFNEFRRQLNLKPYRTWLELTDNEEDARKLELIYGPGQEGIERCDLLVGDMYERKVQPAFALSETSFIIFLFMASRRLSADPFLNELYNEETYSKFGLKLVKENKGLFDLLERHYPDLAADFKDEKGKAKQSCFKPILPGEAWKKAIENKVVPEKITKEWETTKQRNAEFFDELEAETEIFTKNLKANSKTLAVFDPSSIWTIISVLLVVVPYYVLNTYEVPGIGIKPMFPADDIDIAKEFAYSTVRHNDSLNRILHLFTNPMIFVSQCFLLDQTPAVFGLKVHGFKVNAALFYLMYLCFYSFLLDVYSGFFNLAYSILFYSLFPKFGNWVTRVVGVKWTNAAAFVIYFISQYSQILIGHNIRENFYDWNIYHLFPVQQLITVFNIMRSLRVYPSFVEATDEWVPIMRECMGKINFEDCVKP